MADKDAKMPAKAGADAEKPADTPKGPGLPKVGDAQRPFGPPPTAGTAEDTQSLAAGDTRHAEGDDQAKRSQKQDEDAAAPRRPRGKRITSVTHTGSEVYGDKGNPRSQMRVTGTVMFADGSAEDRSGYTPLDEYRAATKDDRWKLIEKALRAADAAVPAGEPDAMRPDADGLQANVRVRDHSLRPHEGVESPADEGRERFAGDGAATAREQQRQAAAKE